MLAARASEECFPRLNHYELMRVRTEPDVVSGQTIVKSLQGVGESFNWIAVDPSEGIGNEPNCHQIKSKLLTKF
jgi:hypothetical protein